MREESAAKKLQARDLPRVLELARSAGWNQSLADLERMLHFAPDSCFGLWRDARLLSTAMAFSYPPELGWVAMVLTDPAARGQGFATMLTQHAVDWLRGQQVAWIKLDASPRGQPIYERLGFVTESRMERRLPEPGFPTRPFSIHLEIPARDGFALTALPLALDRKAFGADRTRLLGLISGMPGMRIAVLPDGAGYAMLRPGSNATQLGPMVCEHPAGAEELLAWAMAATHGEPLQWDLDTANSGALQLAEKYQFRAQRVLARMRLAGQPGARDFAGDASLVYAIGGFDFG